MELADFLRARLDEDEADARQASEYASATWHLNDLGDTVLCFPPEPRVAEAERRHGLPVTSDQWRGITIDFRSLPPHIARHDPARVLADIEAKRQIVGIYEDAVAAQKAAAGTAGVGDLMDGSVNSLRFTLRLLALPYADHPDYRPEWKP